jgi:leader peptidase (prepilin peptidase)/N-methyltransferase
MTTEPDAHLDAESRIPPRTDLQPTPTADVEAVEAEFAPLVLVQLSFDSSATQPAENSPAPPRKRRRQDVWWMSTLAGLTVAILIGLFGIIFIALPFGAADSSAHPTVTDRLPIIAGALFVWVWIVFLGASFGSFINCVAWRLPRGIPITAAGSACPKCHSRLRWHENLPIYGWLALNGQCGSCNEPIPARYVLVEVFFAISFVMIAYADLIAGDIAVPLRPVGRFGAMAWTVMYPDLSLERMCIFGFHCAAIVFLWLWTLLSWDRHPVPRRTIFLALACLAVAASFWSDLIPVTVLSTPMPRETGLASLLDSSANTTRWVQQSALPIWSLGLVTSLVGLASGAAIAWLGSYGQPGVWRRVNLISAYALVGAVVGWQGLLSVALINSAIVWAIRMLPGGQRRQPFVIGLPLALVLHLWNWRLISTLTWWPGMRAHWSVFLLSAIVVLAMHQAAWRFYFRKRRNSSLPQAAVDHEAIPEHVEQPSLTGPSATTSMIEQNTAEQSVVE